MASKNLVHKITADTSGYSRGIKQAKSDLKSFESVTKGAMDNIGSSFGISTGKIDKMTGTIRELGARMTESSNQSVAALGKMLASIDKVSVSVGAIGVGALVAGFKALAGEAANFKQQVQGANIEMATAAYIDTYKQVLHDFNGEIGEGAAKAQSKWEIFWKTFGSNAKQYFFSGAMTMPGDVTSGNDAQQAGADKYMQALTEAIDKAQQAQEIQNNIYKIQRQISDELVRTSELDAQIASAKRDAFDSTLSTQEQYNALNRAVDLIRQKYEGSNGIISLNKQLADNMAAMNDLASSTPAAIDAANQQRIKANNLVRQENEELKALSRRQSAITNELERQNALKAQIIQKTSMDTPSAIPVTYRFEQPKATTMETIKLPVQPELDEEATVQLGETLQSVVNDSISSISESIGTLIGDLATGGDAWDNFANAAMSSFADMAISVGKLAIATGTASLGILESLELQPELAIAAGAALVALGAAVKAGLSNVASGNYSASTSVATSTYSSSGSSDLTQREINVVVKGTLQASGNTLVAVLNNENNRKNHTT